MIIVEFKRFGNKEAYYELEFNSWMQMSNFLDEFYTRSSSDLHLQLKIYERKNGAKDE